MAKQCFDTHHWAPLFPTWSSHWMLPLGPSIETSAFQPCRWPGWALQLPPNKASFLGWREDATDKWIDAQCLPASLAMSSLRPLRGDSNQWHATTAGGAWPKTSTTPSTKPVAAGQARPKHSITLDPVECPVDWVQAYAANQKEPPTCGQSSGPCSKGPPDDLVRPRCTCWPSSNSLIFRLPAAQNEKLCWWYPPPGLSTLGHQDLLPHWDFQGVWDIQETQKEQTLVLSKTL